jgi:hypothetical protein
VIALAELEMGGREVMEEARWIAVESCSTSSTVKIVAGWGGGEYHHAEVIETEGEVRIRVLVRHHVPPDENPPHRRTGELQSGLIEAHLLDPLGQRVLVGVCDDVAFGRALVIRPWEDRPPIDIVKSHRGRSH